MENVRNTKNRYNARRLSAEDCKRLNDMVSGVADKRGKQYKRDKLNEIEAAMDKRAADIALTISDMFKFMATSAAMLPNMELDTGIMHLKVDDGGVFFEINAPYRMRKAKRSSVEELDDDTDALDDLDDLDDDEEGLLYDGD